jgi:hypothetical protein
MEKNNRTNWLHIFYGRTDGQTNGKIIYRLGFRPVLWATTHNAGTCLYMIPILPMLPILLFYNGVQHTTLISVPRLINGGAIIIWGHQRWPEGFSLLTVKLCIPILYPMLPMLPMLPIHHGMVGAFLSPTILLRSKVMFCIPAGLP